jgi:hypothetical protein
MSLRQLLGVRWPGAALVRRKTVTTYDNECFFKQRGAWPPLTKAAPGRRTPRS